MIDKPGISLFYEKLFTFFSHVPNNLPGMEDRRVKKKKVKINKAFKEFPVEAWKQELLQGALGRVW